MMKSKTGTILPYNFGHKVMIQRCHCWLNVQVERWISSYGYPARDIVLSLLRMMLIKEKRIEISVIKSADFQVFQYQLFYSQPNKPPYCVILFLW